MLCNVRALSAIITISSAYANMLILLPTKLMPPPNSLDRSLMNKLNRCELKLHPCFNPVLVLKEGVTPSLHQTTASVLSYKLFIAEMSLEDTPTQYSL
uniref:Putative secreted protein n=1 Tax=Panstrongylus lignarius TaxID=156445 RepID=A0A224XY73_9HEMI